MKKVFLTILSLFPLVAFAQEVPAAITDNQENGIQIIDGKKFFPLNGARRQLSSDLSPSALAIINSPRIDPRVNPAYRAKESNKVQNTTSGNSTDDDILSVFAPEEYGLKSRPLNSTSPYRK